MELSRRYSLYHLLFLLLGSAWGGVLLRDHDLTTFDNATAHTYLAGDIIYMSLFDAQELKADQRSSSGRNTRSSGRAGSATDTHNCNSIRAVPQELRSAQNMGPNGLGYFYQKYTEAYGIPVLGSYALSDSALQRACYTVRFIFADSYAARNSYYKKYGRFALMGVNEVTTNIPEHADLGSYWDTRARGLGATISRPVSTGGEENALCLDNDRYRVEDILLHEFAHGVHLLGLRYSVPNFDNRLRSLYNNAKATGLWRNTYAMSTDHEYFAEGVQSYFGVNGYANPPNGIHNHVNTREALRGYDPGLYNLVSEVFPCGNTYIKRCDKDRAAELSQDLKLNCVDGDGGDGGEDGCKDDNMYCIEWAVNGECERNPGFMLQNCKKSCNACDGTGPSCEDSNSSCSYWASIGECQRNPAYMLQNCKKSCNSC